MFAPTSFGPIGPSSGSVCWALLKVKYCGIDQWKYIVIWFAVLWQQVTHYTARSTHTTTGNTCCHNKSHTTRHAVHTPQPEILVATTSRTQHGTQYTHHSLKYLLPQQVAHNTVRSTHTTAWNTCYHNKSHTTRYAVHTPQPEILVATSHTLHGTQYTHHSLKYLLSQVAHYTTHSTHITAWNTCCHNKSHTTRHAVHTSQPEILVATTPQII